MGSIADQEMIAETNNDSRESLPQKMTEIVQDPLKTIEKNDSNEFDQLLKYFDQDDQEITGLLQDVTQQRSEQDNENPKQSKEISQVPSESFYFNPSEPENLQPEPKETINALDDIINQLTFKNPFVRKQRKTNEEMKQESKYKTGPQLTCDYALEALQKGRKIEKAVKKETFFIEIEPPEDWVLQKVSEREKDQEATFKTSIDRLNTILERKVLDQRRQRSKDEQEIEIDENEQDVVDEDDGNEQEQEDIEKKEDENDQIANALPYMSNQFENNPRSETIENAIPLLSGVFGANEEGPVGDDVPENEECDETVGSEQDEEEENSEKENATDVNSNNIDASESGCEYDENEEEIITKQHSDESDESDGDDSGQFNIPVTLKVQKPKRNAKEQSEPSENPFIEGEAFEEDEQGNLVQTYSDDDDEGAMDPELIKFLEANDLPIDEKTIQRIYRQQLRDTDKKQTNLLIHGIRHGLKETRQWLQKNGKKGLPASLLMDDIDEGEDVFGESAEHRVLKRLLTRAQLGLGARDVTETEKENNEETLDYLQVQETISTAVESNPEQWKQFLERRKQERVMLGLQVNQLEQKQKTKPIHSSSSLLHHSPTKLKRLLSFGNTIDKKKKTIAETSKKRETQQETTTTSANSSVAKKQKSILESLIK